SEILSEYEIEARLSLIAEPGDSQGATVVVTVGRLTGGFELPKSKLIVHVESDIFDEAVESVERRGASADQQRQASEGRRRRSKAAAFLSDFRDLRPNDFVV